MYLLANLALFLVRAVCAGLFWRTRRNGFLLLLIVVCSAAAAYGAVRSLAPAQIDLAYLSKIAEEEPELRAFEFDLARFVTSDRPPVDDPNRSLTDQMVEVTAAHPWEFTEFTVWTQWFAREGEVVAVLAITEGRSGWFSFPLCGPCPIGGNWFAREDISEIVEAP